MSMSQSPSLPLRVVSALDTGKLSRSAAIALLAFDHLITLDLEIDLVWKHNKKRLPFFLYIFNRFFALIYLAFDSVSLTPSGEVSSKVCVIYLLCDGIVTLVTTLCVQAILQLRVYALYDRSRKMLIFLIGATMLEIAAMAILTGITISHLFDLPIISTNTGCFYQGLLGFSALFWVPGLVYEPVLLLLVLYKAWPFRKQAMRSNLIARIARDSLIYFAAIFVELFISTIIWSLFPTYINIVNPWSAALPSILGSRLLLNMREAVSYQGEANPNSYFLEFFVEDEVTSVGPIEQHYPDLANTAVIEDSTSLTVRSTRSSANERRSEEARALEN